MPLPPRYAICPACSGIHKGIPECLGRRQDEVEWMIDRGIPRERAKQYAAARTRRGLGSIVLPPDPLVPPGPPFGRPEPAQEALF